MQNPRYITIKEFLVNSPESKPKGIFLLAHGAGKGMANPFMETVANAITAAGVRVVRFHFPYMEEMVRTGKKIKPNGGRILRHCFSELIDHCVNIEKCPAKSLIIGGKSMGGRIASMIADEKHVAGVICLGYPFHPPRKPAYWRIEHLKTIQTPTLICQGERDPFGSREEVQQRKLSESVEFKWIPDGDHNFRPRKLSGQTEDGNMQEAVQACIKFINRLL
jgi:predicted alpha/beta-hydrolase family hydrolase